VIRIVNENQSQKNEEILYEEWVPTGRMIKGVILFLFLMIISIGIIVAVITPREFLVLSIVFGVVGLIILFLFWNFRGLRIFITKNLLEVRYGIFNYKKIQLEDILDCEKTKASFKRYGGIGIRLGWDGSIAYNTDFGEAIKLILRNRRPFVFSTRNSIRICSLIQELSN
jgi:hypothetical protein